MRPAIAFRWITALVEPPIAALTRIAFSNAVARQDLRQRQVLAHHLDDAHARQVGQHVAARVDGRDRRVVRQRDAQRLGHAGHGRGRAHGVAGAGRARHAGFGRQELVQRDLAGLDLLVRAATRPCPSRCRGPSCLPLSIGPPLTTMAGTSQLAAPISSAGVVLSQPTSSTTRVDRVAADRFLDVHAGEVAREHRGRAQVRLAVAEHRELDREAAGLEDAALARARRACGSARCRA